MARSSLVDHSSVGRFPRALLLATAAATAVALFVPVATAGAKTTVTTAGGVVTVHVNVDVYGGEGQTGPDGQPLDQYWEQIVKDTWGQAFDQLPYKNCFKFELDLDIRLRSRDATDRDGWHRIHVTAPRNDNDWRGVGWGKVPETSRDPRTGDGTRSFENDQAGTIPVNAPPTVVAHEFGHVFGLGDDRQGGMAKPGRDGTLMVGGADGVDPNQPLRIDKDLVDRIGKLIEKHLEKQGKKLPACESWQGTFRQGIINCPGTDEWTLRISVAKDGSVIGNGTLTSPGILCPDSELAPEGLTLLVSGNRDRNAFHLTFVPCACPPLDLRVAGNAAKGSAQDPPPVGSTYAVELTCKRGCDEKVA